MTINNYIARAAHRVREAREAAPSPPRFDADAFQRMVRVARALDRKGDAAAAEALVDRWLRLELAAVSPEGAAA